MSVTAKHYTIAAEHDGAARSATRALAPSAMVLADKWAKDGCKNVRITTPSGSVRTRGALRAELNGGLRTPRHVMKAC